MEGLIKVCDTSVRNSVYTGLVVAETVYALCMFIGETVYITESVYTRNGITLTRYTARYEDEYLNGMPYATIAESLRNLKK